MQRLKELWGVYGEVVLLWLLVAACCIVALLIVNRGR